MTKDHPLTVSLEEFGLSRYEAQAYVTLISKGTISASELAYYSKLPRTKAYPTLLKLEKKKLAIISKSKPIMCTAIAPEDAFDEVIQEQINKINAMNTLVSNLKKVSEESKKSRGSEEKRYFHISANNVLDQMRSVIEGAKVSIHMTLDQWGLGLLAECKMSLISVLRRNLDVKIIIPSTQVGTENYKKIPNGAKVKVYDIVQNCIIIDETELLLINSDNGKAASFSSTEVLGANESKFFSNLWKNSVKTDCLADMTKTEAQEVYRIIKTVNEDGLVHLLNSVFHECDNPDLYILLEKSGISLKTKTMEEIIEIIDSTLQITCSGNATFDDKNKSITIESKINSGNSLPWASILDGYLKRQGYKTRLVYQNNRSRGEKIHIKLAV